MNRILFFLFFNIFFITVSVFPVTANPREEAVDVQEEQKIEEQIKELSEEWQKKFVEAIKEFLDKELERLKTEKGEPPDTLKKKIESYEASVRKGNKDPDAFFALGKLYDRIGDGANAIIYTKQAERIFEEGKNVKGVAEARRSLRSYYEKYQYQPEDFELAN